MPTYEYQCTECDHKFEVFQSMSDDPIENCEKCTSKVRKLFSSTGIIFKGSGFYVNDYKNKKSATESAPCGSGKAGSACSGCSAAE